MAQDVATVDATPKSELAEILRAPMPIKRTFTHYVTARSAAALGFAYIYIKADATVDAQNNQVMSLNGAWSYQADASRNFERWEQLSLQSSKGSRSIWVKATGYAYFRDAKTGMAEKMYLEIEHTWNT